MALPPWLLPVDEWRNEVERLRTVIEPIIKQYGRVPPEHLATWQRFAEFNDNPPAAAVATPGDISAPEEIRPFLALFPESDLRFVRSIRVESRPGELQRYLSRMGAPILGTVHGWNAGGDIYLWAGFRDSPDRSVVGRMGKLDLLAHEIGHTIYNHLPETIRVRWDTEIHPRGGLQFALHAAEIGEWNPTGMASESAAEDFAETYRLIRFGGIDPYLTRPVGDKQPGEAAVVGERRRAVFEWVDAWLTGVTREHENRPTRARVGMHARS